MLMLQQREQEMRNISGGYRPVWGGRGPGGTLTQLQLGATFSRFSTDGRGRKDGPQSDVCSIVKLRRRAAFVRRPSLESWRMHDDRHDVHA